MQGFSIIICTYNPKISLLERLFQSIKQLTKTDFSIEVILVDNNSRPRISTYDLVKDFLESLPFVSLINESSPGLTSARIAGIHAAKYDWLVFFDDDNEPDSNYLIAAKKAIQDYPQVGAWGPGEVNVIYTDEVNIWLQKNKNLFQQRNEVGVSYSFNKHWQADFPNGTGMIIQKEIADKYASFVINKEYTITDRKGKEFSSGGDLQLVLTSLLLGKAVGVNSEIKLSHLIHKSKTSFSYLKKLIYGTTSSYHLAFNEVYPNQRIPFSKTSNFQVIRLCWFYLRQFQKSGDFKSVLLFFIRRIGEINANYLAYGKSNKPIVVLLFERLLIG